MDGLSRLASRVSNREKLMSALTLQLGRQFVTSVAGYLVLSWQPVTS